MEAFGAVKPRPIPVLSVGSDSLCQRKTMRIASPRSSRKLAWGRGHLSSLFLDMGHLEYYYSSLPQEIGCGKVCAGGKIEKKPKKKNREEKEKKKSLKMLKSLSRDLVMCSETGLGLDSGRYDFSADPQLEPNMISDALVLLQGQVQQLWTKEKELKLTSIVERKRLKAAQLQNLDCDELSTSSSESSDSECNTGSSDVLLQSNIDMQKNPALLLKEQVHHLWTKEKEVHQKSIGERSRLKASLLQNLECDMLSSFSPESSNSECGEVADMNSLSCTTCAEKISSGLHAVTEKEKSVLSCDFMQEQSANELQAVVPQMNLGFQSTKVPQEKDFEISSTECFEQSCCTEIMRSSRCDSKIADSAAAKNPFVEELTKKIEVCMGGKCKKSGAGLLLDEFERLLGSRGAVTGCKCMGKCRDGPNVRVLRSNDCLPTGQAADPSNTSANRLCIGVGVEDVALIVASFLRESGLVAAS